MRKLSYIFIAFLAVAFVSCGGKTQPESVSDSDSVATDSISESLPRVDSLKLQKYTSKRKLGCWEYKSEVEYPVSGNESLISSIRDWISESLIHSDGEEKVKKYSSDLADGQSVLDYYASSYMESIDYDNYIDLPEGIECELDIKITKEFENPQVVSFNVQTYWYGGGAHGGSYVYGASFRKSDGKRLGWNLLFSKKAVKSEIISQLKKYFDVSTDEELMESLMLSGPENSTPKVANIPYPATEPWISADGLFMIYQQYEIACYAAGMPSVLIPWSKLPRYLSEEYKSLFD